MLWRFVYNLLVNVSHCVLKDFVGWEKWLTRQLEKPGWRIKFLKGFFSKPPCCTPEFPPFYHPVSFSLFLSHSLIVFLSLSLSVSLFAIAPNWSVCRSLSPTTCRVCSRRVEERSSRVRLRYVRSVSSQSVQLFRSVSTCRNPSIDETNLFKPTPFALGSRLLCRRASKTVLPPFGADLKLNLVLKFDCGTCLSVGESNCCNYILQTVLRAHQKSTF